MRALRRGVGYVQELAQSTGMAHLCMMPLLCRYCRADRIWDTMALASSSLYAHCTPATRSTGVNDKRQTRGYLSERHPVTAHIKG